MAIAVGSSVRFNINQMRIRFPRITDEFNLNSPMTVTAIRTGDYTIAREGKPLSTNPFKLNELVEVTAPVAVPAPPLVPDALP